MIFSGLGSIFLIVILSSSQVYLDNRFFVFAERHFERRATIVERLGGVATFVLLGGATFPLVEQSVDFVDLTLEPLQLWVVGFALLVNKFKT
jgi:hypothetical protein